MVPKQTTGLLTRLRALMKNSSVVSEPIHAYIVPHKDAHQSEYIAPCDNRLCFMSGFTGSAGMAIITDAQAALWTDGRYHLQASNQVDENWTVMKDGLPETPTKTEWLSKVLPKGSKVGADPFLLSADEWFPLEKSLRFSGLNLHPIKENLVDKIWDDRPSMPCNPLIVLSEKTTGCSWPKKVEAIRSKMRNENASVCIFTKLDEIAYLFNMRGSDIDYNPLFFSYVIITLEDIHLFIDEKKITSNIRDHLTDKENKPDYIVNIHAYNEIHYYIPKYADVQGKIWISSDSAYGFASSLQHEKILNKLTPIALMKAVKNATEIAGMCDAHLKDAVCLSEYFAWLEEEVPKGNITEIKAADKLEEIKRTQDSFVSPSFATISSVGSNGAIIHYRPSAETDKLLTTSELYLCDCGSQYNNGTTDVTRTVHFGEPTDYEKECFTRVLKGHINLATAVFPNKINGNKLDTLARTFLWDVGLDYMHGTGHGVGAYLAVHEGPCSISKKLNKSDGPLEEGMILSDEPGFYKDKEFGIRLESLMLVKKKETKYDFNSQIFLTFEPITLVPIQIKMIKTEMLSEKEKCWLNSYHEKICKIVAPVLLSEGKQRAYEWLMREAVPV